MFKLFIDGEQFKNEINGYDKVMGDPSLGKYASKYKIICLKLDEVNHDEIRKKLPFCKVVFIPYFSKPTWKEIGKLDCEANAERNKIGVDVNSLWKALYVIGVAPWKATFFVNTNTGDIKAIDFTYSENSERITNDIEV